MAITVSGSPRLRTRFDHIFFAGLAATILVIVFVGFAQTYYLAGVLTVPAWKRFAAPPHPLIVNIHGVMLIATITLLPAALVRWPVLIAGKFLLALTCCLAFLILIAAYDLWSKGTLHRATLWGSAVVIVTNPPVVGVFSHNAIWFRVAQYMQTFGQFLR